MTCRTASGKENNLDCDKLVIGVSHQPIWHRRSEGACVGHGRNSRCDGVERSDLGEAGGGLPLPCAGVKLCALTVATFSPEMLEEA